MNLGDNTLKVLIDGQTLSTPEVNRGIGTYLINTLEQMVKAGMGINLILATYNDYDRSSIASICDRISIVSLGDKLSLTPAEEERYGAELARLVKLYDVDVLWIPNCLMLNVHALREKPPCKTVLTVYDLIPLVYKDLFFNRIWSENATAIYLKRLATLNSLFDEFIAISKSTREDLIRLMHLKPETVHTIYLGYKKSSIPLLPSDKIRNKYGVKDYILYVGGFDPRKNMTNSVLAFKKLINDHRITDVDYLITCAYDSQTGIEFSEFLEKNGLTGRVKLTGYVTDYELLSLYKHAKVFFFPSLYEGFGLPLLEAMAAGIPIAASNCSSIPEVVGSSGCLFDPTDIADMADALYRILCDDVIAANMRDNGISEAKNFSWKRCADETASLIRELFAVATIDKLGKRSLKIAYFSPLSPQKSGIAVYSEELLPHLKKYVDVDLFLDEGVVPDNEELRTSFRYYSYKNFPKLMGENNYDCVVYHMGNNSIHKYIYETLLTYQGITVLHDFVLHPFIQHITLLNGNSKAYADELVAAYSSEGERLAKSYLAGVYCPIDFIKYPLNERIVTASARVVVHSNYVLHQLKDQTKAQLILHGRDPVELSPETVRNNKVELGLDFRSPIIGCFGFMNRNKRINVLIDVFARIVRVRPNSTLLLVGDIDRQFKDEISIQIQQLGISENVVIAGYKAHDEYYKYLTCTDLVVNLRHPTMGETSGTLLDALAMGKPVIVSNTGSYREVPDQCFWKVDVDSTEQELLFAYIKELITNDQLRATMGRNAKDYIAKNHKWDMITLDYLKMIVAIADNHNKGITNRK